MTKEEAIYLLNNLRSVAEGKEDEAIDMAIEALSEDAVSREQYQSVVETVASLTEEVGKVVRCKDCRHGYYDSDTEYYYCGFSKGLTEDLNGNDYCSYGQNVSNFGERAEQEYKLPGYDEVMEALNNLTIKYKESDKDV